MICFYEKTRLRSGFFVGGGFFRSVKRRAKAQSQSAEPKRRAKAQSWFPCCLRFRAGWQAYPLPGHAVNPSLGARGRHPWRPTVPAGGKPASPGVVSLTDGWGTAGLCFCCLLGRDGCGWLVCLDGLDGFLFGVGIGWFGAADQRSALPPNLPMNSPPNLPTYLSTHHLPTRRPANCRPLTSHQPSANRHPTGRRLLPSQRTRTLSGVGAGGLAGPLGAMDGANEPYLIGIWQFRCREPAWAAV